FSFQIKGCEITDVTPSSPPSNIFCTRVECSKIGVFTLNSITNANSDLFVIESNTKLIVHEFLQKTAYKFHDKPDCSGEPENFFFILSNEEVKAYLSVTFTKDLAKGTITSSLRPDGCQVRDIVIPENYDKKMICFPVTCAKSGEFTIDSLLYIGGQTITIQFFAPKLNIAIHVTSIDYYSDPTCQNKLSKNILPLFSGEASTYVKIGFSIPLLGGIITPRYKHYLCSFDGVEINNSDNFCTLVKCTNVGDVSIFNLDSTNDQLQIVAEQPDIKVKLGIGTTIQYYSDNECQNEWESSLKLKKGKIASAYVKFTFDKAPKKGTLKVLCSETGCTVTDINLVGGSTVEYCTKIDFTIKGEFTIRSLESTIEEDVFGVPNQDSNKIVVKSGNFPLYSIILLLLSVLLF
ncbi:MAG: hypothetical protein ACRC42_00610, partial [Mycoplasma sp.]